MFYELYSSFFLSILPSPCVDVATQCKEFWQFVRDARNEYAIDNRYIINADQTPLWLEMSATTTVEQTGVKSVPIRSAGCQKERVTVMLACTATGEKLKPWVFFKRKRLPKGDFPNNVMVGCQANGWMEATGVIQWLDEGVVLFLKPKFGVQSRSAMLVLDSYRGHLTKEVKARFAALNIVPAVIPAGCTADVQPLDVSVNKSFKASVRQQYQSWFEADGMNTLTPADLIKKSFLTCSISNALDGSEDHLVMAHRRSQLSHEVEVDDDIQADGLWGNNSTEPESDWLVWRARLRSGAPGAGGAGDAGAGGAGVTARAGGPGGTAAAGPRGARTRGAGAAMTGGVGGTRAGDPTEPRAAGAGGSSASGAGAGGAEVGGTGAGGAGAAGAGAVDTGVGGARGIVRPRLYFVPLCQQVLGVPSSTSLTPPLLCPPPGQSQPPLLAASPLPAPSPYNEQSGGLTEPASRPVLPVRTARRIPRLRPPPVPGTHAMALRPSSVPLRVPLRAPPQSSLLEVPDPESDRARAASPTISRLLATAITDPSFDSAVASALVAELLDFAATCRLDYATSLVAESASASPLFVGGECALGTNVLEDRQEEFECLAAAVPRFASMLLAPEGDPDAPDIPTPRSYAETITGPYSSQWQAAMDAEMGSKRSTGTYVDEVPPPGANIVDGMWIFRGVDYFHTFSPTPKMTTLRVLLHVAAQCDYELHSLDFSTAFLQGSLHEEIWLRRPPGFTGSFPAGTQWSLCRPVYGLRQAPCEWHDTLRNTLAALGFAPSTADLSLFLRTDTSLPPFYVLVYVDDLVFTTADTEALTLVKSQLQKRHTCTDLGELRSYLGLQITRDRARGTITLTQSHMVHMVLQRFRFQFSLPQPTPLSTSHSLSAPPSDESVEPSGSYPELVGCLITSGMGLMLGGRGPVVLTGHADASWVDDSATQRSSQGYTLSLGSGSVSWRSTRSSSVLSSNCEAEIYAGAMAAQELRWLTYLMTDLGEQPCSPPVLYVDNKAMIALCQEHKLEHKTKHIALRYFLARELQQRGQLRLAYVATRANTADVFTKALPPGDHQHFSTVLGLVPTLPHLLTA
ncbi:unnamed protein product [Closterium sp. NIES-53]